MGEFFHSDAENTVPGKARKSGEKQAERGWSTLRRQQSQKGIAIKKRGGLENAKERKIEVSDPFLYRQP